MKIELIKEYSPGSGRPCFPRPALKDRGLTFAEVLRSTSLLSYGSRGEEVRLLQKQLNKHGYNLKVDGIFGPKTRAAVLDFQRRNGLQCDGMAGPQTLKALNGECPSDFRRAFVDSLLPILQENLRETADTFVVLAQAVLETGWGRYIPGGTSCNIFGLTGKGPAGSVRVRDGTGQIQQFRSYASLQECVADYLRVIKNNPRYSKVFAANNPEDKARALQEAGYASDPRYAEKLCAVMSTLSSMGIA